MILVNKRLAVIEQNLVIGGAPHAVSLPRPPRVSEAGPRNAGGAVPRLAAAAGPGHRHVGVCAVLQQSQGQGVHEVEILGGARVLDHVHQGEEDVVGALGEPHVGVQSVL